MSGWKEKRERVRNRDMEDMVGDGGGESPAVEETVGRRWRWCRCSGVAGSNGEMGSHHGDEREREREREREKKNKKETKGWPEQEKPPQVALLAVI